MSQIIEYLQLNKTAYTLRWPIRNIKTQLFILGNLNRLNVLFLGLGSYSQTYNFFVKTQVSLKKKCFFKTRVFFQNPLFFNSDFFFQNSSFFFLKTQIFFQNSGSFLKLMIFFKLRVFKKPQIFFKTQGFFFKLRGFFQNSDFFQTRVFFSKPSVLLSPVNNAHVIYLLTTIAGLKKMNMMALMIKMGLSVLCFMSLWIVIIKSVIAFGGVSLWVSSISWDTK